MSRLLVFNGIFKVPVKDNIFMMIGWSRVYDTTSPNMGENLPFFLKMPPSKHPQTQKMVNNTDITIVHGYVYIVKTSANGRI